MLKNAEHTTPAPGGKTQKHVITSHGLSKIAVHVYLTVEKGDFYDMSGPSIVPSDNLKA
jgi:hypothetical protein